MRPRCRCRIRHRPRYRCFKPVGVPRRDLQSITLSRAEAEALRLKYLSNLHQERAAEAMNISQSSFQRLLASANRKTAEAIFTGKALEIES